MKTAIHTISLLFTCWLLGACGGPTIGMVATSDVVDNANSTDEPLSYLLYSDNVSAADPNKIYGLVFTNYDNCSWMENHNPSLLPKDFKFLGIYLNNIVQNTLMPPTPGTYALGNASQGDGLYINNANSGFGSRTNCADNWQTVRAGSVNLTTLSPGVAGGTLDLTLGDGSAVSGTFRSTTCFGTWNTPPIDDPDVCP